MPPNLIHLSHIEQEERGDCLAVCASIVLSYLGLPKRKTSLKRVTRILKIDPDFGTPFPNIVRLKRLGVTVQLYESGTLAMLRTALDGKHPCIVSVKAGEFPHWVRAVQHAVVVVGMNDRKVWIHDPAFHIAPIPVPIGDFDLAWFGMGERFAIITD